MTKVKIKLLKFVLNLIALIIDFYFHRQKRFNDTIEQHKKFQENLGEVYYINDYPYLKEKRDKIDRKITLWLNRFRKVYDKINHV